MSVGKKEWEKRGGRKARGKKKSEGKAKRGGVNTYLAPVTGLSSARVGLHFLFYSLTVNVGIFCLTFRSLFWRTAAACGDALRSLVLHDGRTAAALAALAIVSEYSGELGFVWVSSSHSAAHGAFKISKIG